MDDIPVSIAERHVHLTAEVHQQLFSAPAADADRVTLVGPAGRIGDVRVVGPARSENQVEISQRDALRLGLRVPLRESGDLKDTPGVILEGPHACVRLENGVIRNLRHIHLDPAAARTLGLEDRARIDVATLGSAGHTVFCDVIVRVAPGREPALHLDNDESDAAGLATGSRVALTRNGRRVAAPL